MPILWLILAVILVEQAAPGLLGQIGGLFAGLLTSPAFLPGFAGASLAAAFWMSLGRSTLARQQRDAAIEKAEKQYQQDKGWF